VSLKNYFETIVARTAINLKVAGVKLTCT